MLSSSKSSQTKAILGKPFDVIIIGDEVESVITAVSAARQGLKVALVRDVREDQWLGGLSTRGGLAYMDITPECLCGIFGEFLTEAGVRRVALEPNKAHQVLDDWLNQHQISVFHGVTAIPGEPSTKDGASLALSDGQKLNAKIVVDATSDADLVRAYGVTYREGLGGLLQQVDRKAPNYLGVTPVFTIEGVSTEQMQDFETALREERNLKSVLEKALPYHAPKLRDEYITRPTFSPADLDYLDILNPVIGVTFHRWRGNQASSYPDAETWIDGGNVALLPNRMAFNGLVMRVDELNSLLGYSHGAPIPSALMHAMEAFETFLQREGGMRSARIEPPQALYVRQTLNVNTRRIITAQDVLQGGAPANNSVGTFSYWIDVRGVTLSRYFPGINLPKPTFGVSLDSALFAESHLENLAVVSRSGGYSPLAQGAGRIVQHGAILGEAIGVAASLAIKKSKPLNHVLANEVQPFLQHRELASRNVSSPEQQGIQALLNFDSNTVS